MAQLNARNACVDQLLQDCPWGQQHVAEAFAPANIALCKYWGKRNQTLHLPITDSLSVSLGQLGSHCRVTLSTGPDAYFLQGQPLADDSSFARRLHAFLDLLRGPQHYGYCVEAHNSIPTAAGFASSASGFAALVQALNALHGWKLADAALSILARLGSGSACRSIWQGFVHWHAGTRADGLDCYAEPLRLAWPALRVGLLTICAQAKQTSSREAMQRTVDTSPLYAAWPDLVARDIPALTDAIQQQDFAGLGSCAEANALAMHATMLGARPPVLYWKPASVQAIQQVQALRAEGVPVYLTMDAGPNLKLLFLEQDRSTLEAAFPALQVTSPW